MIGEVLFASGHPAQAVGAALEASKIYEDLSLAAANDRSSRMNVGRISSDLGDDEVAVANDPQTPIAERSAHRRAGCSWYLNSQEIYGELREHAKLTGEDATNYDSNARQLALCDAGLAAAAGARTSPASR